MIKVTLKDIETNEEAVYFDQSISVWSWTEGNWWCDCNRVDAFGEKLASSLDELYNDVCFGKKRFIVVNATGDLDGLTKEEFINKCNNGYHV